MLQPRRHRRRLGDTRHVVELRRRRSAVRWLIGPLAPGEAALVSLVLIALLLLGNGLIAHKDVADTLLIAALAGTMLRLFAWLRIAGGRR